MMLSKKSSDKTNDIFRVNYSVLGYLNDGGCQINNFKIKSLDLDKFD
ncbi:hypothetical protein IGJ02_000760 [Enterococcus sp. DIV0724b]